MVIQKFIGLILLLAGIITFIYGYNATHTAANRWSHFFTGNFTDHTVWTMILGVILVSVGSYFYKFGDRMAAR